MRGEGWPVPHRGFDFLDDDIHLSFVQPRVDSNFEEVIDRDSLEFAVDQALVVVDVVAVGVVRIR